MGRSIHDEECETIEAKSSLPGQVPLSDLCRVSLGVSGLN